MVYLSRHLNLLPKEGTHTHTDPVTLCVLVSPTANRYKLALLAAQKSTLFLLVMDSFSGSLAFSRSRVCLVSVFTQSAAALLKAQFGPDLLALQGPSCCALCSFIVFPFLWAKCPLDSLFSGKANCSDGRLETSLRGRWVFQVRVIT